MARMKTQTTEYRLNAYFTQESFVIDNEISLLPDWLNELAAEFESDKYGTLFHLGFTKKADWFSPSIEYLYHIAELLIKRISQHADLELCRESVQVDLSEEDLIILKDEMPFVTGMEYADDNWIRKSWDAMLDVFKREIKSYDGTVARYFTDHDSNINVVGRVFFHLVESNDEKYPFAFMATYSTKPVKSKRAVHTPLKNALEEFDGDDKKLLSLISTVIKAAEKSCMISDLLESGELFAPIKFTAEEAYTILKEIQIYEEAGIMCRVPDWWRKNSNSIRISVTVGEKKPSVVGLDAILDFSPSLKIGDETLTEQELRAFLDLADGLILYKGKWVEVGKKKLETLLQAFDRAKGFAENTEISLGDAMRLELNANKLLNISDDDDILRVTNGQWLKMMRDSLKHPSSLQNAEIADTFRAKLRTYQANGYKWLHQMSNYGLGACLADDMGLGKTVQMIALLEHFRKYSDGRGQVLLIMPASLIGNWQKEIEKFAPGMSYQILHKSDLKNTETIQIKENQFLYITTYGMTSRLDSLRDRKWDYLILDEAQAIKNPGAKQTKAVKQIPSKMRIAMTGTPIENRLSDLWSLFDFINQGLLGTAKEFTEFTKDLSYDATGYAKLRKMIQPFILRRLKTDKNIISDLPDKLESNAYTTLSGKQVALYTQILEQIEKKLRHSEGIERKGLILSSIMKFKQICNHPDQYLGREEYKPEHSGKFELLREICETICEKRERVLIFTQFKEMTEPISDFLKEIFMRDGFVLHGETAVKRRNEMVTQFNGERYIPYMVLSLKAGGVGLNLTAANHVIHFDRWWNPAVENQATDRAFRIGQTKNVMVHKFITKGTIEEKIDMMIAEKQKLSADILSNSSSSEQWISELNDEELMKILRLDGGK